MAISNAEMQTLLTDLNTRYAEAGTRGCMTTDAITNDQNASQQKQAIQRMREMTEQMFSRLQAEAAADPNQPPNPDIAICAEILAAIQQYAAGYNDYQTYPNNFRINDYNSVVAEIDQKIEALGGNDQVKASLRREAENLSAEAFKQEVIRREESIKKRIDQDKYFSLAYAAAEAQGRIDFFTQQQRLSERVPNRPAAPVVDPRESVAAFLRDLENLPADRPVILHLGMGQNDIVVYDRGSYGIPASDQANFQGMSDAVIDNIKYAKLTKPDANGVIKLPPEITFTVDKSRPDWEGLEILIKKASGRNMKVKLPAETLERLMHMQRGRAPNWFEKLLGLDAVKAQKILEAYQSNSDRVPEFKQHYERQRAQDQAVFVAPAAEARRALDNQAAAAAARVAAADQQRAVQQTNTLRHQFDALNTVAALNDANDSAAVVRALKVLDDAVQFFADKPAAREAAHDDLVRLHDKVEELMAAIHPQQPVNYNLQAFRDNPPGALINGAPDDVNNARMVAILEGVRGEMVRTGVYPQPPANAPAPQ